MFDKKEAEFKTASNQSLRTEKVRRPKSAVLRKQIPARYHKTELRDDADRTQLLYNVQDENMELKKQNMRLLEQNKVLEIQFAKVQKDMIREGGLPGVTRGMEEIEKIKRQVDKRSQQTRQGPQTCTVGGALRRRLSPNIYSARTQSNKELSPRLAQELNNSDEVELRRRVEHLTRENEMLRSRSPRREPKGRGSDEREEELHNDKMDMMRRVAQSEKEKLEVESELRHLKAFDEKSNLQHWKRKVGEAEENNKQLLAKVTALTKNAFLGTADARAASGKQLEEMEQQIKKQATLHEKNAKEKEEMEAENADLKKQHLATSAKVKELLEDNERFRIRLEEKDKQIGLVENQVKYLNQSLPPEECEALQRALRAVVEDSPANFATFDPNLIDRSRLGSVPSTQEIAGTETAPLTRVIDLLRAEKGDLAQELNATKELLVRESAINRDLKELNRKDTEDLEHRLQASLDDKEKWEQIARTREKRLKEVQRKVDSLRYKEVSELPLDVVSESGFTDVSELKSNENALDVILSAGRLEECALMRLPKTEWLSAHSVMTCVSLDFFEFDSACSEVGTSLNPQYDSVLSFGPFVADTFFFDYISSNTLKCELNAFVVGSRTQYLIGIAQWELVDLLIMPSSEKPNPMHIGVLRFCAVDDPNLLVAEVPYKIKLRYAIFESVLDYMAKHDVKAKLAKSLDVDPTLVETYRKLRVRIIQASGLVGSHANVYCFYEIPGTPQIFTRAVPVSNGIAKWNEDSSVNILIDAKFQDWAQKSKLRFVLFDEHIEKPGLSGTQEEALGVVGEVTVDIKSLLSNPRSVVDGSFSLRKNANANAPQVGSIELQLSWADRNDVIAETQVQLQTQLNADTFAIVMHRLSRSIDLRKLTLHDWFAASDTDRDGFLSEEEFSTALESTPLGLTLEERRVVWRMMDTERLGKISQAQFLNAISTGTKMASLEAWAKDIMHRVVQTLLKQKKDPHRVFEDICVNQRMHRGAFIDVLTSLNLDLTPQDLDRLWSTCDTKEGSDFNTFSNRFGLRYPQAPTTSSYVVSSIAPVTLADKMSDTYYEICLGRIGRQIQARGPKVFEERDKDHDEKLSRQEFLQALADFHVGLSEWEKVQIFERLDAEGQGVRLDSLSSALSIAEVSTAPNKLSFKLANEVFARVAASIQRSGKSMKEVFENVAFSVEQGLNKQQLAKVLTQYDSISSSQIDQCWEVADKNHNGTVGFKDFEAIFSRAVSENSVNVDIEERFTLVMSRVYSKLIDRATKIEDVFSPMDQDRDGNLTPLELKNALRSLQLGLSLSEREMVSTKMDLDGKIALVELQNALKRSDIPGSSAVSWAKDIFFKIQKAIARAHADVQDLFNVITEKANTMSEQQFATFVMKFEPSLSGTQMSRLWTILNKNEDGSITFQEFQSRFTETLPLPEQRMPSLLPSELQKPSTSVPSTARSIASSADEDFTIFQRIQRRTEVSGKGLAELMRAHDTTKTDTLNKKAFVSFINSLNMGLSTAEIETFLKKFDTAGLDVVKIADFVHTVDRKTAKLEAWAQSLIGRVSSSIARAGQPPQEIFKKFCAGGNNMNKEQFTAILRAYEKDLSQRHVDRLWNLVDKDQSGDIDLSEFRSVFELNEKTDSKDAQTQERLLSYGSRLTRTLKRKNTDIRTALVLYDHKVENALDFAQWRNAVEQEKLGLSSGEAEWLFWNMEDHAQMRFEALEKLCVETGPLDVFSRALMTKVEQSAQQRQSSLYDVLQPFGEWIEQGQFRQQLQTYSTISDEQWSKLVLVMDKSYDDRVAWQRFLEFTQVTRLVVTQSTPAKQEVVAVV